MFPIALNLTQIPIFLAGEGEALARRKRQLEEAGARFVGGMEEASIVMVAGLPHGEAKVIADAAREQKKLVHVEDMNDLCDFYFTANLRRGELLIAVSTEGASPTLAKRVRNKIGEMFDESWAGYTEVVKEFRLALKSQGKTMKETAQASEAFIDGKGWFKP